MVVKGHEYFEKTIQVNQQEQWLYKLAGTGVVLGMTGVLVKGRPQYARAGYSGYGQKRGRTGSS